MLCVCVCVCVCSFNHLLIIRPPVLNKGMLDCAKQTMAEGGPARFYSGYPTFVGRITPHIMLTWVFMDNIRGGLSSIGW